MLLLARRAPPPIAAAAVGWVRHSTSLWRNVPVYKRGATARYRILRGRPKPTMPVRVEGVKGADSGVFKHGVLLPDGYLIPWVGQPHDKLIAFWRRVLHNWDALIAERKAAGLDEWFCCPRCDGFLQRLPPRADAGGGSPAEELWACPTPSCGIDAARIKKRQGATFVEVTAGVLADVVWRRRLRESAAAPAPAGGPGRGTLANIVQKYSRRAI